MEFSKGTPPAPTCGQRSPYTELLRPRIGLDTERCQMARDLKRHDPNLTAADIAGQLGEGATEGAVLLALATIRSRNPRPTRSTINATIEAADFVMHQSLPDEPRWMALDRLLGELAQLRAVVAGLSAEKSRRA